MPFGIVSGIASYFGGKEANRANARQAREQSNFQAHMSNSAHQREVSDLRAAGLNPILSATGGQGASTPQGAKADMQDFVTKGITTGMEVKQLEQNLASSTADIELKRAQGVASVAAAERDSNSAKQSAAQTRILNAQYPESQLRGQIGGAIGKGIDTLKTGADKVMGGFVNSSEMTKKDSSRHVQPPPQHPDRSKINRIYNGR